MQRMPLEKSIVQPTKADTIIISARVDSFHNVFLGERSWYPLRIDDRRKPDLKWICVYQNTPVRAITHYAQITGIEKYLETGRYRIRFAVPIELNTPIVLGLDNGLTMQGQKYTSVERLLRATTIADLKPWNQ